MRTFLTLTAATLAFALGCTPAQQDSTQTKTTTEAINNKLVKEVPQELVVYSGRSAKLVGPIFEKFEAKTKIKVKV